MQRILIVTFSPQKCHNHKTEQAISDNARERKKKEKDDQHNIHSHN